MGINETVLNGFVEWGSPETVGNGSRNHFVELAHRAEAAVLMRSLRATLHKLLFLRMLSSVQHYIREITWEVISPKS